MTEKISLFFKEQVDELVGNSLAKSFKMFGLNTFMIQVNQAQIAGINQPQDGLTPEEAEDLRKYILDSAKKLKD